MLVLELNSAQHFCILGFSCTWSYLGFVSFLLLIWQSLVPSPHIASDGNFVFITDSAGIDCMETVVPSSRISSAPFFTETQRQFSRYYNEFEELKLLGRGAFGAVIKVWYKNCFLCGSLFGDMFVSSEAKQYIQCLHGFIYCVLACCACVEVFIWNCKVWKVSCETLVGDWGRSLSVWGTLHLNCSHFPGERKTSCIVKLFFF